MCYFQGIRIRQGREQGRREGGTSSLFLLLQLLSVLLAREAAVWVSSHQ